MRDDHRRFRLSGMDQLAQASVIGLDVRLSGGNALPLDPEIAEVESELAFLGELVCAARIFWYEYRRDIQVTEFEASIDKGKGWISKCLSKKYLNQRNHL